MKMSIQFGLVFAAILLTISCGGAELQVLYGNYRYMQGEYAQATINYIKALERRRFAGMLYYNLGNVYHSLGETDAALNTLDQAITLGTEQELLFRANFNLGNLYYELGEYDRAVSSYIAALDAQPNALEAKVNLELALEKADGAGSEKAGAAPLAEQDLKPVYRKILGLVGKKEKDNWAQRAKASPAGRQDDW